MKTTKQTDYYETIVTELKLESLEICKINECTEDKHNCESYAYFDYDKETKEYSLATICYPDYCQKCYASYVCLPFEGNIDDLLKELEGNLLEEYWD